MVPGVVPLRHRTVTGIVTRSSSAAGRIQGPARVGKLTVLPQMVTATVLADPVVEWPVMAEVAAGNLPVSIRWRCSVVVSHRLRILFAGGLLCFAGLVFAQPDAGMGRIETDVWGDPEDEERKSDRTWTWFGMGYENRAQTSVRPVDAAGDAASGTGNSTGGGNGSGIGNGAGKGSGRSKARGKGRNQ